MDDSIPLQHHFSASTTFAHVELWVYGRKGQGKVVFLRVCKSLSLKACSYKCRCRGTFRSLPCYRPRWIKRCCTLPILAKISVTYLDSQVELIRSIQALIFKALGRLDESAEVSTGGNKILTRFAVRRRHRRLWP
jgi:hypothetical protein